MIKLTEATLVGKGLHREVYVHPENLDRCIKVVVTRGEEETRREQAYYRFLQCRKIHWKSLPQFYGNVDTNIGVGAVFDLVRDHSGGVSKTLEFYLEQQTTDLNLLNEIINALTVLKLDLVQQNIITMTLKPKNIVLQRLDNQVRCIIIDNIGNSDVLPISSYFRFFGRLKIERKWTKFKQQLLKYYPNKERIKLIVEKI